MFTEPDIFSWYTWTCDLFGIAKQNNYFIIVYKTKNTGIWIRKCYRLAPFVVWQFAPAVVDEGS